MSHKWNNKPSAVNSRAEYAIPNNGKMQLGAKFVTLDKQYSLSLWPQSHYQSLVIATKHMIELMLSFYLEPEGVWCSSCKTSLCHGLSALGTRLQVCVNTITHSHEEDLIHFTYTNMVASLPHQCYLVNQIGYIGGPLTALHPYLLVP